MSEWEAIDRPCPFCGSDDFRYTPHKGAWDTDIIYCGSCKTEFRFHPEPTYVRWNRRTDGECPFCGGKVEFDGVMNYSEFFADAYCPTCRIKFEFQGIKKVKSEERNLKRAKDAMARRG